MSHITIIISKSAPAVADNPAALETSYEFCIPVPHGATPKQVGELTRQAFKQLEGRTNDFDQGPSQS